VTAQRNDFLDGGSCAFDGSIKCRGPSFNTCHTIRVWQMFNNTIYEVFTYAPKGGTWEITSSQSCDNKARHHCFPK
jgi:hypothetical protein